MLCGPDAHAASPQLQDTAVVAPLPARTGQERGVETLAHTGAGNRPKGEMARQKASMPAGHKSQEGAPRSHEPKTRGCPYFAWLLRKEWMLGKSGSGAWDIQERSEADRGRPYNTTVCPLTGACPLGTSCPVPGGFFYDKHILLGESTEQDNG